MKKIFLALAMLTIVSCGDLSQQPSSAANLNSQRTLPEEIHVRGVLVSLMAIGGESTGFGIETNDGQTIELDLSKSDFRGEFPVARSAQVTGYVEKRSGIERKDYEVLVARALRVSTCDHRDGNPEITQDRCDVGGF